MRRMREVEITHSRERRVAGDELVNCVVVGEIPEGLVVAEVNGHHVVKIPERTCVNRLSMNGRWIDIMFTPEGHKLALWGNELGDPLPTLTESDGLTAVGRFLSNLGPVEYVVGDLRISRREGGFILKTLLDSLALSAANLEPEKYAEAADMAIALATRIRGLFPDPKPKKETNEAGAEA